MSPKAKQKNSRKPSASALKDLFAEGRHRNLYVSLPSHLVPEEMLDGRMSIDGLRLKMLHATRGRHVVSLRCQDPEVHLYALDKSLEKVQVEYMNHTNEILTLRNRLMLMAMRLGLADEVPSVSTHTTWPQLADKILNVISPSLFEPHPIIKIIEKVFEDAPHTRDELISLAKKMFKLDKRDVS